MNPLERVWSFNRAFPLALRRIGEHTAAVLLFLLASLVSLAQTPDGLQPQGLDPSASYHHSDIDSVNMESGRLSIHIPLYAIPQKGRLALSFSLVDDTNQFRANKTCTAQNYACYQVVSGFARGMKLVADQVLSVGYTQFRYPPNSNTFFNVYSIIDSTGASHLLGYDNSNMALLRATDGSGLLYAPAGGTPDSPYIPAGGWGGPIYEPNGTRQVYNPNTFGLTINDPDGNSIAFQSVVGSGWPITDSLGHQFPNGPPNNPSGSTSGCPTINANWQPTTGSSTWTVPGPNGGSQTFLFCYTTIKYTTAFFAGLCDPGECQDVSEGTNSLASMTLQSVVLPNGTYWGFIYDAANPNDNTSIGYGQIAQIRLPTGGTISYQYSNFYQTCKGTTPNISRSVTQRKFDPGNGGAVGTLNYSFPQTLGPAVFGALPTYVNTATDPLNNDTVYSFSSLGGCDVHETKRQSYQGSQKSGKLLRTTITAYQTATSNPQSGTWTGDNLGTTIAVFPTSVTTTLDNGQATTTSYQYNDGGFTDVQPKCTAGPNNTFSCTYSATTQVAYGRVTSASTTDYGGTTPLKTLQTQYQYQQNSSYFNANFMDLISSSTTLDSSGHQAAKTSYGYDENNGSPQGVFGHRTSVNQWLNTTGGTVTTQKVYNSQGMVTKSIDALSNPTTTTYDSTGIFPSQIQRPDTTTNGVTTHHIVKYSYDPIIGRPLTITDESGNQTSNNYDIMGRLTSTSYPDNGSTTYCYTDTGGSTCTQASAPPYQAVTTKAMSSSQSETTTAVVDGLGRVVEMQTNSDPDGVDYVDTTYDAAGRVASVTNAYRTTKDPTYGSTSYQYDALGRTIQITHPDGSTALTSYTGRATQAQDEGNGSSRITHIAQADALGRLVSVCEVTATVQAGSNKPAACNLDIAGTGFLTTYQYNALGNLTSVQQGVVSRSFTYDSLSRLLTAQNPESGTICYGTYSNSACQANGYDNNGNLLFRTKPAPNQTSSQTTMRTSYQYDALNRLTQTSYCLTATCPTPDPATPAVTRNYDTTSELGITLTNTTGRLSAEYSKDTNGNTLSARVYSYDKMGRVKDNSQCTPQNCPGTNPFPITYTYDLEGNPLTATNGMGVTFSYNYDAAARLSTLSSSLVDGNHPGTLFSGPQYNPLGSLTAASLGNVLNEAFKWDCRGRILAYASSIAPLTPSLTISNTPGCPITSAVNRIPNQPDLWASFLRKAGRTNSRRLRDSILLSREAKRSNDHGSVKLVVTPVVPSRDPQQLAVSYRKGESALSIAQRLANQINDSKPQGLTATLRQTQSGSLIELTSLTPIDRITPSVSVFITSNHKVSSIKATKLKPPGGVPALLGASTGWTEGQ